MIFKQIDKIKKGKKANDFFAYINHIPELLQLKSSAKTAKDFLSHEHIL